MATKETPILIDLTLDDDDTIIYPHQEIKSKSSELFVKEVFKDRTGKEKTCLVLHEIREPPFKKVHIGFDDKSPTSTLSNNKIPTATAKKNPPSSFKQSTLKYPTIQKVDLTSAVIDSLYAVKPRSSNNGISSISSVSQQSTNSSQSPQISSTPPIVNHTISASKAAPPPVKPVVAKLSTTQEASQKIITNTTATKQSSNTVTPETSNIKGNINGGVKSVAESVPVKRKIEEVNSSPSDNTTNQKMKIRTIELPKPLLTSPFMSSYKLFVYNSMNTSVKIGRKSRGDHDAIESGEGLWSEPESDNMKIVPQSLCNSILASLDNDLDCLGVLGEITLLSDRGYLFPNNFFAKLMEILIDIQPNTYLYMTMDSLITYFNEADSSLIQLWNPSIERIMDIVKSFREGAVKDNQKLFQPSLKLYVNFIRLCTKVLKCCEESKASTLQITSSISAKQTFSSSSTNSSSKLISSNNSSKNVQLISNLLNSIVSLLMCTFNNVTWWNELFTELLIVTHYFSAYTCCDTDLVLSSFNIAKRESDILKNSLQCHRCYDENAFGFLEKLFNCICK